MKIQRPNPSLWKNKQGLTREIAIEPPGSQFSANDFNWRISNATVSGDTSFSNFPNYDRWLIIWKGAGLIINGKPLEPFVQFEFSGEAHIDCKLIQGAVEDLGIIYRRDKSPPEVLLIPVEKSTFVLSPKPGSHLLFCAKGCLAVSDVQLQEGESFSIPRESPPLEISSLSSGFLIAISFI